MSSAATPVTMSMLYTAGCSATCAAAAVDSRLYDSQLKGLPRSTRLRRQTQAFTNTHTNAPDLKSRHVWMLRFLIRALQPWSAANELQCVWV